MQLARVLLLPLLADMGGSDMPGEARRIATSSDMSGEARRLAGALARQRQRLTLMLRQRLDSKRSKEQGLGSERSREQGLGSERPREQEAQNRRKSHLREKQSSRRPQRRQTFVRARPLT